MMTDYDRMTIDGLATGPHIQAIEMTTFVCCDDRDCIDYYSPLYYY